MIPRTNTRRFITALLAVFLVSCALFYWVYATDNKQTWAGPQAAEGRLTLAADTLEKTPLMFLIKGWELYRGKLLTPQEIAAHTPDAFIDIGKYKTMEFGDMSANPHGSATYRLVIDCAALGEQVYTLQLPEIYSAYHLYINGEHMRSAGVPEHAGYMPMIFTGEVTFLARDQIEIIFAVTDFSHYYSGIISPPAFGDTLRVNTMVQGRLVWRTGTIAAALTMGVLVMLAGFLLRRRRPGILFLLLSLCFAGYTCYVIVHALFPAGMFWYYFETFCYYTMFFLAIWLHAELCGIHTKLSIAVKIADATLCALSIFVPLYFSGNHTAMLIYSQVVSYYKLFLLGYLSVTTLLALRKGRAYTPALMYGLSIFWAAAILKYTLPKYDPILLGQYTELGCLAMLFLMGGILVFDAMRRRQLFFTGEMNGYPAAYAENERTPQQA